jgi:hypothetical protein
MLKLTEFLDIPTSLPFYLASGKGLFIALQELLDNRDPTC